MLDGAILGKDSIENALQTQKIVISPLKEENIGPASYDISLSNEFRIFQFCPTPVLLDENTDYKDYTRKMVVEKGGSMSIHPKTTILGITEEHITLPSDICALLNGRSRFARMGLFIHITAFLINPGGSTRLVLEIFNSSNYVLQLQPGTKIGQLVFVKMDGNGKYAGKFLNQEL